MFSCKFCEIFPNKFLIERLRATASLISVIYFFLLDLDNPVIVKKNTTNNLSLTCLSEGNPIPSYQWLHLGKVISNHSVLNMKNINDSFISSYVCVVRNSVAELKTKTTANSQCKQFLKISPSRSSHQRCSIKKLFLKISQ